MQFNIILMQFNTYTMIYTSYKYIYIYIFKYQYTSIFFPVDFLYLPSMKAKKGPPLCPSPASKKSSATLTLTGRITTSRSNRGIWAKHSGTLPKSHQVTLKSPLTEEKTRKKRIWTSWKNRSKLYQHRPQTVKTIPVRKSSLSFSNTHR